MVIIIFGVLVIPSTALTSYSYGHVFTTSLTDNMYYTGLHERESGNAYVNPSYSSISTLYFLSPHNYGYLQATDILTITQSGKRNFTWKSGYGGTGNYYCLVACPDNTWYPYPSYPIGGYWAE